MIVDPSVLPVFFVSAFIVMIAPGADLVFIVTNSVSGGKRSGTVATLGIASGAVVHFIAAALGISAIILSSEIAYDVVRFMGAGYFAWIGFQYLSTKTPIEAAQVADRKPTLKIYRQGVFTNLLNPKAILFNLSFVPQFVSIGYGPVWLQMLVLGGILIGIGLLINLSIVMMSNQLSLVMKSRQQAFGNYFEKAAGLMLIGIAVYIAVSRRPV